MRTQYLFRAFKTTRNIKLIRRVVKRVSLAQETLCEIDISVSSLQLASFFRVTRGKSRIQCKRTVVILLYSLDAQCLYIFLCKQRENIN